MPARPRRARLQTLIGPDTTVRGDIHYAGVLVVEGRVAGDVYGASKTDRLILAPDGVIEGSVELGTAQIEGRVDGDVTARAQVDIGPRGLVTGSVRAQRVRLHPGGTVAGAVVEQAPDDLVPPGRKPHGKG